MMYCPLCGAQNDEEHVRAYQDGSRVKKFRCVECKTHVYIDFWNPDQEVKE